jgi:hypothetical protein
MNKYSPIKLLVISTFLLSVGALATTAYANHSWGNYHWARTANPFTIKLGDNVSSVWDAQLAAASSDWSASTVLDTAVVAGGTNATKGRNTPKNCVPTSGRVEVCNARYGSTGWLGIASIWTSGDHITQGTVKLNDTYFTTAKYNTPAWKQFVVCQEIGHTFGLDHQDEDFYNPNLGTCMDYTNDPTRNDGLGDNQHPNTHDYDQLETIYAHLDDITTILSGKASSAAAHAIITTSAPSEWGEVVKTGHDRRPSLYARDLDNGQKVFTFVVWAD